MTELVPDGGWTAPAAPRLSAPPPGERGWLLGLVSRMARRMGRPDIPDVIAVLHLNPRLFWPWIVFASRLMPRGRLPARLRELIILRTAWNCRSRYEWGQHVDIGLRVGLTDDEIARVPRGPAAFPGTAEGVALQACDEMCRQQFIAEDTWRLLGAHHREKALIELMLLIGHYVMIAGFLNSSGLVLEPPIEAVLQSFHGRLK
jgi:4-carboxymuconolactone decarboxylase